MRSFEWLSMAGALFLLFSLYCLPGPTCSADTNNLGRGQPRRRGQSPGDVVGLP